MLEKLMTAIVKKNNSEVKDFSGKMDMNVRTKEGDTPLMSAIRNNLTDIAQILIANGANPDFPDNSGWYPLHFATQQRNFNIVKLLVENGATIDQGDGEFGNTPLQVAITTSNNDRTFIDYFLGLNADPNKPNKLGQTPTDFAEWVGVDL
jgi:ankyrin repeat protein